MFLVTDYYQHYYYCYTSLYHIPLFTLLLKVITSCIKRVNVSIICSAISWVHIEKHKDAVVLFLGFTLDAPIQEDSIK